MIGKLKAKVYQLDAQGLSSRRIAQALGIGKSTVSRILAEGVPVAPTAPKQLAQVESALRRNPAPVAAFIIPTAPRLLARLVDEFLRVEYGIVDEPEDHRDIDPWPRRT